MSIEDEEKRRRIADLAASRAREEKSRAARNNALDKGYMRPDLAGPSIDRFYKNKGADALKDKFGEFTGPSEFGVKKGNPFTRDGRAKRADANEARRDLPQLWDDHAQDRKNREASERAYRDKYGPPEGQDTPSVGQGKPQPKSAEWRKPQNTMPVQQPAGQTMQPTSFMDKLANFRKERAEPRQTDGRLPQGRPDSARKPRGGRGDDD